MHPDPAALAAAIHDYHRAEQDMRTCDVSTDAGVGSHYLNQWARDTARARVAMYGDPAVILGEKRLPTPTIECGSA